MTTNQKITLELTSKDNDYKCKDSKLVINRKLYSTKDTVTITGIDAESIFDIVKDLIEINKNEHRKGDKNGRNKSL